MTQGVTIDFNANLARFTGAVDKAVADLNKFQSNADRVSANVGNALSGLGAGISVGALAAYIKSTADAADALNDLAERTGISTRRLAQWELAAKLGDVSVQSFANGIKGLSAYIAENGASLQRLGIDTSNADKALIDIADRFAEMPDGIEKTNLAVKMFGKAGMEMIPMLNMGSAGLQEVFQKSAAYSRKMAELAPLAGKFNDELDEMAMHSKAAGINIATHLMPSLSGMAKWLNDLASGGERTEQALEWASEKSPLFKGLVKFNKFVNGGSNGYSGPVDALGLPALPSPDAPKSTPKSGGGSLTSLSDKSSGGKSRLDQLLEQQRKRIADLNAEIGDEQMVSVDTVARQYEKATANKAEAMAAAHEARMEQIRIETEGEGAIQEWIDKNSAALKEQKDIANDLGMSFSSAFEDAVIGGKKAGEVIRALGQDIQRIVMRKTITEPFANAVSGMVKESGIGNFFANLFDGFRADGGPVSAGRAYVVGERGPELFMPRANGSIIPNGATSAAPNIAVNVINQTGAPTAARQQGPAQFDGEGWVINVVMERATSDPRFRAAFGLGQ